MPNNKKKEERELERYEFITFYRFESARNDDCFSQICSV